MLLRVPALPGVVVALVEHQPLFLARTVRARAHEHEAAGELLAEHVGVQLPVGDRLGRVVGGVGLPPAAVPDDHVAPAVLAVRDDAFEVDVLDRVILDVHGQPSHRGIERRAPRHRPTGEDTVDLEAHVVVQRVGAVPLHHESKMSVRCGGLTLRLRGTGEVALGVVVRQRLLRPAALLLLLGPSHPPCVPGASAGQ